MEPDWSLWVHDLITGEPVAPLTMQLGVEGDGWSASIGGDGASTTTIVANDADTPWTPATIDNLLSPGKRMIARWWGAQGGAHPADMVVYAHKIQSYDYDRDAGTITITGVDLIAEAEWRMIDGVLAPKDSVLTILNRTPSGAVAQTLARMMQWGPEWWYPIDLPADASGDFSGSWVFWKQFTISEILAEIRERTGVEIFLRPYATGSGGVRFQTRVGAPITVGGINLNIDADETPVAGIKYRKDASQVLTGLLGIGNGTGEDQETRWAGNPAAPIRDTKKSFNDLVGDPLQQATSSYYTANRSPVVQWDVGAFVVSEDFPPAVALPGAVFNFEVSGDPVIPDGVHALRVLAVSGTNGRQVKPEVQGA